MRPGNLDGRRVVAAWRRLLREEEGVALVLAIVSMLVLTITLTAVIFMTAAGARDAQRTNAGQRAYSLAESGVNNALAVLEANYPGTVGYPGDNTLLTTCPASLPTVCPFTSTYPTGTVTWSGTLDNSPAGLGWSDQWNIIVDRHGAEPDRPHRRAGQANGDGGRPGDQAAGRRRSGRTTRSTSSTGTPSTSSRAVTVASPVYTITDLRLQNTSAISEWIGNAAGNPNKVAVGGNFYEEQNANKAGHVNGTADPANELGEMYVQRPVLDEIEPVALHACAWGSTDQIWATTHGNAIPPNFLDYVPKLTCCAPTPTTPPSRRSRRREAAWARRIGLPTSAPLAPCTTGSLPASVFPRGFDTASGVADLDINNSATPAGSAAINLTPSGAPTRASREAASSPGTTANKLRVARDRLHRRQRHDHERSDGPGNGHGSGNARPDRHVHDEERADLREDDRQRQQHPLRHVGRSLGPERRARSSSSRTATAATTRLRTSRTT